jgi:hypothetical protein
MDTNFDEFQQAWKKENTEESEINLQLSTLNNANQPLENIRKNMKLELYLQLAAIGIIGVAPMHYGISGALMVAYYTVYALMIAVSGHYFYRFYLFFKKMHNYHASTRDSLFELYYEIRLHLEMYKSSSYLIFPFALVIGAMIWYRKNFQGEPNKAIFIHETDWMILPVLAIAITLFIIAATNWWVNHFYGKHAERIRKIINDLKE